MNYFWHVISYIEFLCNNTIKVELKGRLMKKKKNTSNDVKKLIKDGMELEKIALKIEVDLNTPEFDELFNEAIKNLADDLTKDAPEIQYAKYVFDLYVLLKSVRKLVDQPQSVRDMAMLKKIEFEILEKIHVQARKDFGLMKSADSAGGLDSSKYMKSLQELSYEDLVRELTESSVKYAQEVKAINPISILELEEPDIYSGPSEQDVLREQKEQLEKAQEELKRRADKKGK